MLTLSRKYFEYIPVSPRIVYMRSLLLALSCSLIMLGSNVKVFSFVLKSLTTRTGHYYVTTTTTTTSSSSRSMTTLQLSNIESSPLLPSENTLLLPTEKQRLSRSALTLMSNESILMMPFTKLSTVLGGSGKARIFWKILRQGLNPLEVEGDELNALSTKAKERVKSLLYEGKLITIETVEETLSSCGTRKFLSQLDDGTKIESVLIPSYKFDRTTLCVSTQVGCDRRCAFCATGKMGLTRNLTSLEIVSQVYNGLQISIREKMPPMTNVVFMGMGDAGRNIKNVGEAVNTLVDRDRFSMASSKCTVSTVGPSPEAFMELAQYPGTLAWSLHSADDTIRKFLVPSTKHTVVELRDGLMKALATRTALKTRTMMIAITLIEGVNDSLEDAQKLADFVRPMLTIAPKIALDLIPYNDINTMNFKRPSTFQVNEFQALLRREGYFVSVRVARGDGESSACGMLTTKKKKQEQEQQQKNSSNSFASSE